MDESLKVTCRLMKNIKTHEDQSAKKVTNEMQLGLLEKEKNIYIFVDYDKS